MSECSMLWPRILPLDQARGILKSPREDGGKRTCRATLQAGRSWLRFLSFPVGRFTEQFKLLGR